MVFGMGVHHFPRLQHLNEPLSFCSTPIISITFIAAGNLSCISVTRWWTNPSLQKFFMPVCNLSPAFHICPNLQSTGVLDIYCCVTNNPTLISLEQQTFIISHFVWNLSKTYLGAFASRFVPRGKICIYPDLHGCWQNSVHYQLLKWGLISCWLEASFSSLPYGPLLRAAYNTENGRERRRQEGGEREREVEVTFSL